MSEKKSKEEILTECGIYAGFKLTYGYTDILKAMEAYHLQFKPSDEEIEKLFPSTYFTGAVHIDTRCATQRRRAAIILRDKIFQ